MIIFKKMNKKGFTLMELLVTVILVAVLASYGVYYYNNTIDEGKLNAAKGKLAALGGAIERYKIENPGAWDMCFMSEITQEELVSARKCGEGSKVFDVFRCGYAEKSLGLDDNFTFYIGCPHAANCGGSERDNTVYMIPKTSSDIFPNCTYFDFNNDKVVEVRE